MSFSASPFGTLTTISLRKPAFTSLAAPFQTSIAFTGWFAGCSFTLSKNWKPQLSSFCDSCARADSEVEPSSTDSSLRPLRLEDAIRQ